MPEKVQRKNNNGCYKQEVNHAIGDKATVKPNQPEQQQHYKNCPQHKSYLLIQNVYDLSDWTMRTEQSVR